MQLQDKLQKISNRIDALTEEYAAIPQDLNAICTAIFLYAKRIHICLQLAEHDNTSIDETIQNDWEYIVGYILHLQDTNIVTGETLSCAVDIIMLLGTDKRHELLRQLNNDARLKVQRVTPLPSLVYDVTLALLKYCYSQNFTDEGNQIAHRFILLSEQRNMSAIDAHRNNILPMLDALASTCPNLARTLCKKQAKHYNNSLDIIDGLFFWIYALSLARTNHIKESLPLFKHCMTLFNAVEGSKSWIGARAGAIYHYHLFSENYSESSEAFLWDFVHKIEEQHYAETEPNAEYIGACVRAVLLRKYAIDQRLHEVADDLFKHRDFCYEYQDQSDKSQLTIRCIENFIGAYYLEIENNLEAVNHLLTALDSIPPNGLNKNPSDLVLYTNLLQVFSKLNDIEQMRYYYPLVLQEINRTNEDDSIVQRSLVVMRYAIKKFNLSTNAEQSRSYIDEYYQEVLQKSIPVHKDTEKNIAYALFALDQLDQIARSGCCSAEELRKVEYVYDYFLTHESIYPFSDNTKAIYYSQLAHIRLQLGTADTAATMEKSLSYLKAFPRSSEARIDTLRFATEVYYKLGNAQRFHELLGETLESITSSWQKATAYVDDRRIAQALSFVQRQYASCYSIIRNALDDVSLYEQVLRFKDLASLAGRERNRILRSNPVDNDLRTKIVNLQDRLAAANFSPFSDEQNQKQIITQELQKYEAQFVKKFTHNGDFTEISLRSVYQALPDDSVILEYFFVPTVGTDSSESMPQVDLELDLFIVAKKSGQLAFNHLSIPRGFDILDHVESYIDILQHPDDVSRSGARTDLACKLYQMLIKPAAAYISGIPTVYIAPDDQLCNLPFEILCNEDGRMIQDDYTVCRLVCGRDFLFAGSSPSSANNCFVLGDPDYESETGEISPSSFRCASACLEPVSSLPFSGIEALIIGQQFHTNSYTGSSATKYALRNALPCRVIHLATHGIYDKEMHADALYSSHMVFAGYNKWVKNQTESEGCGNGILTADEISRMDLRNTDLVVLSACQSGIVGTQNNTTRGLISAFAVAGAKWIVCHMWNANDFATPILMNAFYDAYLNKCLAVPEALQYAKNFLRNVTVAELRRAGWFNIPDDSRIAQETKNYIASMNSASDKRRPFTDEYYWGGFTVHRTR